MTKGKKISLVFIVLSLSSALVVFKLIQSSISLDQIHSTIEQSYQDVEHISAEQFEAFEPQQTLVFDVRQPEEHAVSHLQNAILLHPSTKPEEFLEDFGEQIEGRRLVFYCSVGRRSSDMLNRLLGDSNVGVALKQARAAVNLEGGVFAWVNSERTLVNSQQQETTKVHPFNAFWGELIEDKSKHQY